MIKCMQRTLHIMHIQFVYGAAAGPSENTAFNGVAKSENRFGSPSLTRLTLHLSRLEI